MTRVCLVLLAAAGAFWLAAAADRGPAAPAARFESTVHDFGTIAGDARVSYQWPVFNDGTAPLEIVNTFPSCGCTASLIETKAIAPGARGSLAVTFDATGQAGDVRKTIAVVTNDPAKPRTILTIRAKVLPPANPRVSSGHPPIAGQSLLVGSCGECHARPASGKSGEALWVAVCAMCHGADGRGALAYGLREPSYLASHDDKALADAIAYGTANPRMPGFADVMGGPLDASQIDSLVRLLRTWTPAPSRPAAEASPPAH